MKAAKLVLVLLLVTQSAIAESIADSGNEKPIQIAQSDETSLADLTACGHAIAATTFNMSPVKASNQGIGTEFVNNKAEAPSNRIKMFFGTEKEPKVFVFTKDAIFLNEKVYLFPEKDMVAALLPDAHGRFELTQFKDFPYVSYGGAIIGDNGRMYGYSRDEITPIGDAQKLTDQEKIRTAIHKIEEGLKKRFENIADAIVKRAQERSSGKLVNNEPNYDSTIYDLASHVSGKLKEAVCLCRSVRGLGNIDSYMQKRLLTHPKPVILENLFHNLLGGKPAELRDMTADDLSCGHSV